jgi:putative ABC transport system permease protein
MTESSTVTLRLCTALLRSAAPLAPADVRRAWLREWDAEIRYAATRLERKNRDRRGFLQRARLVARCAGAFAHAAWLRWDRWRLDMLLQDVKYALRTLTRKPGFATITILTLALGIGANAAIFGAVRAVLLRPLPFPAPEQLVQIFSSTVQRPDLAGTASPPDFSDWRRDSTSFTEMAAINEGSIPWTGDGAAEQVPYAQVTGGFFEVLRVPALHGRPLELQDDAIGGPEVVVLSHSVWARRFGSNQAAVGRTVVLDSVPRRIVGVMPPGFSYPLGSELWVPLRFTADVLATQRGAHYLDVIARRKPDVSVEVARSDLAQVVQRLGETYPRTNGNNSVHIVGLRDALVGQVRPAMLMLLGAVGFVLLIVCVNVASLALTRAVGRTRELAVRAALGAGRARLINGLLAESVMLAMAGGLAGLVLAIWATQAIAALDAGLGIPLLDQTRVDGTVMVFTLAVSALAAVLFGTLPAWHASGTADVARRVREDAGTLTANRDRQRLRGGLIVAETALAVVLLIGAGLLMRSFLEMASVDLGFDPARVQTFSISLPDAKYATPAARASFVDSLVSKAAMQPEVEAAGAIFGLPLTSFGYTISMSTLDGRKLDDQAQDARSLQVRIITPDYFRAMGIPVLRGRALATSDRLGSELAVVINQTAATLLWRDADPLGHQFTLGTRMGQGGQNAGGTVVGVARDVRDFGPTTPIRPTVYLAHAQFPVDFMTVVIKARRDQSSVVEPTRALLAGLDSDLPMFRVRTMEQFAANAVAQPRLYLLLLGLFAGVAVMLAAIGIYGVLMHAVAQRTREIGIRLALGAGRGEVVRMVVRQAAVLALAGLVIGLALAFGATRFLRRLLFGVEPTDALTYALVATGLLGIAILASYLPARRASRIDPVTALRYE